MRLKSDFEGFKKFDLSFSETSDFTDSASELDFKQTDHKIKTMELVFKLDWPTRDEIVVSLNRYTRVLCGEKADAELASDKLMSDNMKLYQALLNLPLKSSDADGRHSGRIALDLNASVRLQIINSLVGSHSLVVQSETAGEENKMKMVEQNNDLVSRLAKLPFSRTASKTTSKTASKTTGPADKSDSNGKHSTKFN